MQPLNFSRQALQDITLSLQSLDLSTARDGANIVEAMTVGIALLPTAIKFMLDRGGALFEDRTFKGLDESQPLHLPFDCVALEYVPPVPQSENNPQGRSSKRVILLAEAADGAGILMIPLCYMDVFRRWVSLPAAVIPMTGYLDRKNLSKSGVPQVNVRIRGGGSVHHKDISDDYAEELFATLGFLNALACKNVETASLGKPKTPKRVRQGTALPFDEYHVLMVRTMRGPSGDVVWHGGTHRSPREHIRRGHIRRYSTHSVWIQSMVVNAGTTGKIVKDYAL